MKKILLVLMILFVVLMGYGIYRISTGEAPAAPVNEVPELVATEPTNFITFGTIIFDEEGFEPSVPYLLYEAPNNPALTAKLILDEHSVCATPTGASPCLAMSVTLDVPFDEKAAVVEGDRQANGEILVRKLRVLSEGEGAHYGEPGSRFISWPHALEHLRSCNVEFAMQTHALDVYLTLKDGMRVRAVEPVIDEVFRVLDETREECGTIPVATE